MKKYNSTKLDFEIQEIYKQNQQQNNKYLLCNTCLNLKQEDYTPKISQIA